MLCLRRNYPKGITLHKSLGAALSWRVGLNSMSYSRSQDPGALEAPGQKEER